MFVIMEAFNDKLFENQDHADQYPSLGPRLAETTSYMEFTRSGILPLIIAVNVYSNIFVSY